MKKMIAFVMVVCAFTACNNEGTRTGNVNDTAKTAPPVEKNQTPSSITDTSYRIGDSVK